MTIKLALAVVSLMLISCATTPNSERPLTSEGLIPLTTDELNQTFIDRSFEDVSGSWTWVFQGDGLAQAKAKDGGWETKDQKWSVDNGKLCRSIKDSYPCVNIYKIGDTILFGKADSNDLETWAITEM